MVGISTYARLFIGFSSDLSDFIVGSARTKSTQPTHVLPITILSEEQVSQSLSDPLNQSFKTLLSTAYKDSLIAGREMIKGQESAQEQRIFIEEALYALEDKKRTAPAASKVTINNAITALEAQYKQLNNISNGFDHIQKQLAALNSDFNTVTTDLKDNRTKHRDALNNLHESIEKLLAEKGLPPLPTGEVDNLLRQDSWQEIVDRFYDTGAHNELPVAEIRKIINIEKPTYETEFKIKAFLAVRAVDPSGEKRGPLIKLLDPVFAKAKEAAESLTQREEQEIQTLDQEKIKPIARTIESNVATLALLNKKRGEILAEVTTASDLASIEEKMQARKAQVEQPVPPKLQI